MNIKEYILNKKENIVSIVNSLNRRDRDESKISNDSIESKIEKLTKEFTNSDNLDIKRELLKEIVFNRMELFVLETSNKYTDSAMSMLNINSEESWFLAINYLNTINENIRATTLKEIHTFKALLYELIESFNQANSEYKKAINLFDDPTVKKIYRAFIERANQLPILHSSLNIQNSIKSDDVHSVIERLNSISNYYSRSKKSLDLARKYKKEVLNLYENLAKEYPQKYATAYMNSLRDFYSLLA